MEPAEYGEQQLGMLQVLYLPGAILPRTLQIFSASCLANGHPSNQHDFPAWKSMDS